MTLALLAACALLGVGTASASAPPPPELLASFDRAWERIRDTYYDPAMRGLDWTAVRAELRPRAEAARDVAETRAVLRDLVARLGESHFAILPGDLYGDDDGPALVDDDEAMDGDLGLDARVVGEQVLITRVEPGAPADLAGVRTGWILHRIGALDVDALRADAAKSLPDAKMARHFTSQGVRLAQLGRSGSSVELELTHAGGERVITTARRRAFPGETNQLGNLPPIAVETEWRLLEGDVGYFRFNIFLAPVARPFAEAVASLPPGARGLVLDLRGNPGGIGAMVMGMAGQLVDAPGVRLGKLRMRDMQLEFVAIPQAGGRPFLGPVAVLVDEQSMSTSEILAAGLKGTGRARVFGERTAGMALPSLIEVLPDGDRLQFVTADLTGPDGTRIEGQGVAPDEAVALTREALLAGGDPVLAAALSWIGRQAAAPAAR